MEVLLPLSEGVKGFLKERPYLVRASGTGGTGTSSSNNDGRSASSDQGDLADEMLKARQSGDFKKLTEIKNRIRMKYNNGAVFNR